MQERGGVARCIRPPKRADHGLVRGGLNVPAEEMIGQPENGIEPVEAERDIGQGFRQVVPAADVGLFVEQNIAPIRFRQADRKIDAGAEEAADEGAVDLVRLVDVLFN